MEDNVKNELLENGRIHTVLRSGSNRIITEPQHVNFINVSSKSRLRQRKEKGHEAKSQHITSYSTSKSEKSVSFYSTSDFNGELTDKCHTENGFSTKNIQMLSGGHTLKNVPNHKQADQSLEGTDSKWSSTRRSAYLFYKAAGDWWNVFPKTDYTYAKSSTCRKEIAPGIMTMPNMSRSPLHSYLDRKVVESCGKSSSTMLCHSDIKKYSEDCSDDAFEVSSTTHVTAVKSSKSRIITTVWYMISSVFSVLTLKKYRLGFESTPILRRGSHAVNKSLYHGLEVMCYQLACYFFLVDAWILSLFHRSLHHSTQITENKKHSKYLFLLLIPPLLYLGLSCNSVITSPATILSSSMSGVKNLLPSLLVPKTITSDSSRNANFILEDGNMDLLVQKLLSSSEFKNIILMQDFRNKEQQLQKENTIMAAIKLEQEHVKKQLDRENQELDLALTEQKKILSEQKITNEHLTLEYSVLKDRIDKLNTEMNVLQARNIHLSKLVKNCRKTIIHSVPRIEIEKHITSFLSSLFEMNDDSESSNPENIKVWIKTILMAKNNLEERLSETEAVLNERMREATEKSAETIMASVSDMLRQELFKQEVKLRASTQQHMQVTQVRVPGDPCDECSLTVDQVEKIVNNALHIYDADKTGLVDYALESAGGTVINIRCTENYNDRSLALAFLGMTFPWSSNHPRIALQPEVHPGRCWAFRGAQGYLVIRLAKTVKVSAFSIEHIPVSISHTGNIDAAPKNFSVLGLNSETDHEPVLLGKYMYQKTGPPLQTFLVQNEDAPPYQIVELQIESNHGNLEYTCLYRFRVHGTDV